MEVRPTSLEDVLVVEPTVYEDERGFFFEAYNRERFVAAGITDEFVQDNHSRSGAGVLRGLHYQLPAPQGKLVRVVAGAVWDVAVDLRRSSPTFRRWVGLELTGENRRQLWVPPGFAHGFLALTATADLLYKTTERFYAEHDRSLRWDDAELGIDWPLEGMVPVMSEKDRTAPGLPEAVVYQ